jgi:ribonuclease Z
VNLSFLGINGSIQSKESGNVSFIAAKSSHFILFETSGALCSDIRKAGFDPLNLDAVIISHCHIDHIYAFPSLIHNLWLLGRKRALPVFANPDAIEKAKMLFNLFALPQKRDMFAVSFNAIESEQFAAGEFHIKPFAVEHCFPTTGFSEASGAFTYFADCNVSWSIPAFCNKTKVLIHEAGGTADEEKALNEKGHSSARQAALRAKQINASKLCLVHLPFDVDPCAMLAEAAYQFSDVTIPELLEKIEIGLENG